MAQLKSRVPVANRRSPVAADRRDPAAQLLDASPQVRRRAAQSLAIDEQNRMLLVQRLADEDSPVVRSAILEGLVTLGSGAVVELLFPLLRSASSPLRAGVIEALQQLPDQVAPYIDRLLQDGDPEVRMSTISALESLHHPLVGHWLIAVLQRDPEVKVCAAAADLLGEVGDHSAVPPLRAVKARFPRDSFIQFAADVALGQIE